MNLKCLIPILFILLFSPCNAQTKLEGSTWYSYNTEGDLGSCTFFKDKIVFKSPIDSDSEKSISTLVIEKRLDDGHIIVQNDRKKPPYALMSIRKVGAILKMAPSVKGTSVQEVEDDFKNKPVPSWIDLTEREWYTKEKMKQLEKAPGLDELTRDDLLTAMQWREPLSKKLQQYLEDTQGKRSFMIYRFVEAYRNQKLVELGYNPYKRVAYNLHKQFEGDEEIMKLLNEEIKF